MSTKIAPIFQQSASCKQPQTKEELLTENTKLRKENAALKKENAELKKRKRSDDAGAVPPSSSKKAKTPSQRKKLFEKWAKAAARESAKTKMSNYDGMMPYTATVKETTPWTVADFESLFCTDNNNNNGGVKLQPTPTNKPTSQITILEFDTHDKVQQLFGDANIPLDGYKAQAWKSRNFCKSVRVGDYPAILEGLQVHYNKSKCTLQLQFLFQTEGCYDYDD
ncbi:expressed unknown protein [Seminavis robusta]|uniref:Uncharacterized protein n=1 Tax=Seminavis robusta TaxID=568900 RepID=A0A9N8EFM3_9STRA|nr:expressed unknown protein [Seminavis robusta]|eukprot:Sro928_g221250.1 n/a (223) ;mRNA; f:23551-24219